MKIYNIEKAILGAFLLLTLSANLTDASFPLGYAKDYFNVGFGERLSSSYTSFGTNSLEIPKAMSSPLYIQLLAPGYYNLVINTYGTTNAHIHPLGDDRLYTDTYAISHIGNNTIDNIYLPYGILRIDNGDGSSALGIFYNSSFELIHDEYPKNVNCSAGSYCELPFLGHGNSAQDIYAGEILIAQDVQNDTGSYFYRVKMPCGVSATYENIYIDRHDYPSSYSFYARINPITPVSISYYAPQTQAYTPGARVNFSIVPSDYDQVSAVAWIVDGITQNTALKNYSFSYMEPLEALHTIKAALIDVCGQFPSHTWDISWNPGGCVNYSTSIILRGYVYDSKTYTGIAGASVELRLNGSLIKSTTSAQNGFYTLSGITTGYYDLIIAKDVYAAYVEKINLTSGTYIKDVYLVKKNITQLLTNVEYRVKLLNGSSYDPLLGLEYFEYYENGVQMLYIWKNETVSKSSCVSERHDLASSNYVYFNTTYCFGNEKAEIITEIIDLNNPYVCLIDGVRSSCHTTYYPQTEGPSITKTDVYKRAGVSPRFTMGGFVLYGEWNTSGDYKEYSIAQARITLTSSLKDYETYSGPSGEYSFSDLEGGSYVLTASREGFITYSQSVLYVNSNITDHRIFLQRDIKDYTIDGEVKDCSLLSSVADLSLEFKDLITNRSRTIRTDGAGKYSIDLPNSTYSITYSSDSGLYPATLIKESLRINSDYSPSFCATRRNDIFTVNFVLTENDTSHFFRGSCDIRNVSGEMEDVNPKGFYTQIQTDAQGKAGATLIRDIYTLTCYKNTLTQEIKYDGGAFSVDREGQTIYITLKSYASPILTQDSFLQIFSDYGWGALLLIFIVMGIVFFFMGYGQVKKATKGH